MKNIRLKARFTIPLYNVPVLVVVADDAVKAWRRYGKFVDGDEGDDFQFVAMCCSKDGDFALFFHTDVISSDDVAHEIKHLVDYIMAFIGEDKGAVERPAYLTGYIHKRISKILCRSKIKLNRKRKSK